MSKINTCIVLIKIIITFEDRICGALRDLNVKNTHGRVLLLVKLQASAAKSNAPPRVFFTFFKLFEEYQIAQRTTYFHN